MKTLAEICVGAIVFVSIDRLAKVVSSSVVDSKRGNSAEVDKTMLRVELLTLFVALFIAIQFIKF